MIPQTQSENLQLQNILSITVPAPRVEPILQPPRVKMHKSAPPSSPRAQPSKSPSLDPHPNPWIKIVSKYLKTPQIPKARKTQAAPQQTQHCLLRPPGKFRQIFRTQVAQHLGFNHIFNLPHDLHIYNEQGKQETIDTLLLGNDSDSWWKAVGN